MGPADPPGPPDAPPGCPVRMATLTLRFGTMRLRRFRVLARNRRVFQKLAPPHGRFRSESKDVATAGVALQSVFRKLQL